MKVILVKAHTHNGKPYAAGSPLDVAPHDALWLASQSLIKESVAAIEAEAKKVNHPLHEPLLAQARALDAAAKETKA